MWLSDRVLFHQRNIFDWEILTKLFHIKPIDIAIVIRIHKWLEYLWFYHHPMDIIKFRRKFALWGLVEELLFHWWNRLQFWLPTTDGMLWEECVVPLKRGKWKDEKFY